MANDVTLGYSNSLRRNKQENKQTIKQTEKQVNKTKYTSRVLLHWVSCS